MTVEKREHEGTDEQQPVAPPDWEVKEGRVYLHGEDVTDIANPEFGDEPEGSEEPANPDNVVEEGKTEEEPPEVEEEPEPEKTEEPEKAEEPEEVVEEPEDSGTPDEVDKLKFNLKFRGKAEEVEYTADQIQVRLNKLRAFEENEKEFWERTKSVEPYAEIVKSDWFKKVLSEAYESGELQKPPDPPSPPVGLTYEHLKRKADPDYDEVVEAMATYAMGLHPDAAMLLNTDLSVFLPEYDRIAEEVRAKKKEGTKPEKTSKTKLSPSDAKKKLALKESSKKRASVTKPGIAPEPPDPKRSWQKKHRELERQLRDPRNQGRTLEIAAEILEHRERYPG